ncbi:hypothetical protein GOODEAATRI_001145 [Goodea atripinnis]|uniref:Uncharacterized protein n=1 Tax=Goodea atripinnis TaxID=208336 RepID=A0ABV0P298_9TELE
MTENEVLDELLFVFVDHSVQGALKLCCCTEIKIKTFPVVQREICSIQYKKTCNGYKFMWFSNLARKLVSRSVFFLLLHCDWFFYANTIWFMRTCAYPVMTFT